MLRPSFRCGRQLAGYTHSMIFFLSVVAFVDRDAPRLYSVAPDVISVQKSTKKRECTITVLLRIVYKHVIIFFFLANYNLYSTVLSFLLL